MAQSHLEDKLNRFIFVHNTCDISSMYLAFIHQSICKQTRLNAAVFNLSCCND